MKNRLLKITALSLVASSVVYAGGFKIPQTSTNAVALGAANVAHTHTADAAYYNPANMVFMDDENNFEFGLMYLNTSATNFKGQDTMDGIDIDSESETALVPSIHYVSQKLGDARVGFSMGVPGGSTKRWKESPALDVAEEFTLKVLEFNPTVAYPINSEVSVALGLRMVYSEGIVKSTAAASRDLIGDSIDFGYNIALAYKPTSKLEFGLTYRSQVDLEEEGNAKLYIGSSKVYDGGASVTVPLPALLNVAVAYTFDSKTTVEFVYERNFWSAYKELDFNYYSDIPAILVPSMDDPIEKNWDDADAYRLGITQELDELTLMCGVLYDETPVPEKTLNYELAGADSFSFSFGGRYQIDKSWSAGLAMLYSMKKDRTISADRNNNGIDGEFSNTNALMISAGVGYKF